MRNYLNRIDRSDCRFPMACIGLLLLCLGTGCGHPASATECEEIFKRSAELALKEQNVNDRDEIAVQVAKARTVKGDQLIGACIGKRITNDAMTCVRGAAPPQELDGCLD